MRSIWNCLKWAVGVGPGELYCWWDDLNFYVQWSDPMTDKPYRLYKCTCRMVEIPPPNEENPDEDGSD